jgi:hypothetical protein
MNEKPKAHDGLPAGLADLGEWSITEFTNEAEGLVVRGRFKANPFQSLSSEQMHFLTTFLRCRGVIASMEKELGISYPTVRSRLDALLNALDLAPAAGSEASNGRREVSAHQKDILRRLEAGELTPEEAKKAMKEAGI